MASTAATPPPTLAEFQRYVAAKKIHYFLGTGGMRANSGSDYGQQIATWVRQHYRSSPVGGVTLYDLTVPASG